MVTPFTAEGELDLEVSVQLARWLVDHGSDGLVVAGTTGEGPVLSDEERLQLWEAVSSSVTVPVIAATGTNNTRHSIELTRAASAVGVSGCLVVTPYYNRPSQQGLFDHFSAVAGATALPVMLYDIPVRTGRRIATKNLVRLAHEVPNIVAVKDSALDPAGSARLLNEAPTSFELYSGDDSLTLPLLSIGGVGVVSVASHWAGTEIGEVIATYMKGDVEGARQANARLLECYDFESSDDFPNPMPAKAVCRAMGIPVGQCRPPLGAAPPELDGEARRMVVHSGGSIA